MFDITAITDVTIDSVWSNWDAGTLDLEIWYKLGTCVGSQATPGAWTLVGGATGVTSAGNNNLTPIPIPIGIFVPAGTTIALYVTETSTTGPAMCNYTTAFAPNTAGSLYNQNLNIQLSYAYGKSYPFAASFNPRIWNGRVYYSCCPTPPPIEGPISGPAAVCQGDTVSYWVPQDSLAVSYEWEVPAGDSVVSGSTDSLMQVVIGPNSLGGQICVHYLDTCTNSNDTCFTYTITQPVAPSQPTGLTNICLNDSAFYTIPAVAGALSYNWYATNGGAVVSNPDSTSARIKFLTTGVTNVCVDLTDNCATSDTVCFPVNVTAGTTPANAGVDIYKCDSDVPVLNGNNPTNGIGVWTIINSPGGGGAGVLTDSSVNNTTYVGAGPGVHTLAWTITNGTCPTYTDLVDVYVAGTPIANFSVNNECVGDAVAFNDLTQANGTSISSWSWDLTGDGNANTLNQNTNYVYNSPGIKSATLIVTSQGCSDTATIPFEVFPKPEINVLGLNACNQDPVVFNDNSSIAYGTIDSLYWQFGDGSSESSVGSTSHTYPQAGVYTTTITAVSNNGCVSVISENVDVYHNPIAEFSYLNACQFQELSFQNLSVVTGANITNYAWNLGNGTVTSAKHPVETYITNGMQQVNLMVSTNQGCSHDTTVGVEVFPTPVSEFNYSNSICEGLTTQLEQVSSISYGSIDVYEWTVYDSLNFLGGQLDFSFPGAGVYKVALRSVSDEGCESEVEKNVPVFAMPTADFTIESVCAGDQVNTVNASFCDEPIKYNLWDFGDGSSIEDNFSPIHTYDSFGFFNVKLEVLTEKGCAAQLIKQVEVFERPDIKFGLPIDSGCSPLPVMYLDSTVMLSGDTYNYKWRLGDGEFIEEDSIQFYNYTEKIIQLPLEAIYVSDRGCESVLMLDSMVEMRPQPMAAFDYSPKEITTLSPQVHFIDNYRGAN
jgi:PKD repeat protein